MHDVHPFVQSLIDADKARKTSLRWTFLAVIQCQSQPSLILLCPFERRFAAKRSSIFHLELRSSTLP